MSRSLVFVCLSLLVVSTIALDASFPAFMEFVQEYEKNYESIEEFQFRFAAFQDNIKIIENLRQQHLEQTGEPGEFVYGITKFTDIPVSEFKSRYLNFRPASQLSQIHRNIPVLDTPETNATTWDWRKLGAITPVKDQEQCGSCWAFSATEEIESSWFLANHTLTELSPQQIVSCDTVDGGCGGGDTITAYAYVQKAGGLESDQVYPYTSGNGDNGVCKFNKKNIVAKIKGYTYATPPCQDSCNKQDENKLADSVTTAPVSICVDAESWQFYSSGILSSNCPSAYSDLDHCVQLVGFNFQSNPPYWIIRNSWNTDWGIDGYIYIAKGKNLCGVADEATIVTI